MSQHNGPAHKAHAHAVATATHMSKSFQHTAHKQQTAAVHTARVAHQSAVKMANRVARRAAASSRLASLRAGEKQHAVQRTAQLRATLEQASRHVRYAVDPLAHGGSMLLLHANFVDPRRNAQVVLRCNTRLPATNSPVAALLWDKKVSCDFVDLQKVPLVEALQQGALYVYSPSITFTDGSAYAVLRAQDEMPAAPRSPVAAEFPTVGTFAGKMFWIGRNGIGTFIDAKHRGVAIFRPLQYSHHHQRLVWVGKSLTPKVETGGGLVAELKSAFGKTKSLKGQEVRPFRVAVPFATGAATTTFDLPINKHGVAAVFCDQRDEQGFALGLVRTAGAQLRNRVVAVPVVARRQASTKDGGAQHQQITARGGQHHLLAPPNMLDTRGREVLALVAELTHWGWKAPVRFTNSAGAAVALLEPNISNRMGRWYVHYPNVMERQSARTLISACPADVIVVSEEEFLKRGDGRRSARSTNFRLTPTP